MRGNKMRRNNGRVVEPAAPSVECDFVNSVKAVTEFPRSSFEFYVWSDQGVNLEVDFTSSLSDWTNKFKNEVRLSDNVNGNKSRSLRQDLSGLRDKSSFLWDMNYCQIVDRGGQAKSSSSGLKLTKDSVAELGQQNNGERMTVKVAKNLLDNHSKPLISDPATPGLQHSKPDNGGSGNSDLPNGSCIVNPGVVCPGASLSRSAELQNSKVASCHKYASISPCDNNGSLDLSDPKNTPEMKHFRKAAKSVDGRGRSGCSHFDDPLKKSSLDNDDQVSKTELHKKKKDRYSEIQGSCGKPTARILRSMMKTGVMVLPRKSPKPYNGGSGNCGLSNGSCIVNPGVVCAGASLSSSMELQNSEVASCHKYASVSPCDNDGSLDLRDPKNISEMEHLWKAAKSDDGRGCSGSSQFDDPLKKSSLDYDDQVSKTELHKKRKDRYSEIQGSSGKPTARILRSMMKTGAMARPRKSPRLK